MRIRTSRLDAQRFLHLSGQHGHLCFTRSAHFARMGGLFQPFVITPPNREKVEESDHPLSRSQKLLTASGMISPASSPGTFHLLPMFMRSLDKLTRIIDQELRAVGCQKLSMPALQDASIWKSSGRWKGMGSEMLKFKDRLERECCLGPTHEEAITKVVASSLHRASYKKFPLRLYQTTSKFRDEMKPKHGLLRAREFLMNDLYTFDSCESAAKESYIAICSAYDKILRRLELSYVKAKGSVGSMGGSESHEFLLPCDTVGEDSVVVCQSCYSAINAELLSDSTSATCPECSSRKVTSSNAIEIAHAFLLGTKYSRQFSAEFISLEGKPQPLQMGCYGIGVTRLIAAAVEVLSSAEEIRWPRAIAPYSVCVISPKAGSKEALAVGPLPEIISQQLSELPNMDDEVILDDRQDLTIGRRLTDAKKSGFPAIVIIGKTAAEDIPKLEVRFRHDPNLILSLTVSNLLDFFRAQEVLFSGIGTVALRG